jgi:hypothetical protein
MPNERQLTVPFAAKRPLIYLTTLFIIEMLVFYSQLTTQITPYYPANFDQVPYINITYQLFESLHDKGWWSTLFEAFVNRPTGSGSGLMVQGALLAVVGGPNRSCLLSLNLIYFLALQIALFLTVYTRTRNVIFAWIAIALLLSSATIFHTTGGIFDYRIDFSALCLYGIWACLIVISRTFRDRERAIIAGMVAALLISMRSITVAYIPVVLAGLFGMSLIAMKLNKSSLQRAFAAQTARNVIISGVVTCALALPLLISAAPSIYERYIRHIATEEKFIRARELNLYTVFDHVTYYPRSVVFEHLGSQTLQLMFLVTALTIIATPWIRQDYRRQLLSRLRRYRENFVSLVIVIVAPLIILTLDISKSQVVGSIVTGPIILLVTLFLAAVAPFADSIDRLLPQLRLSARNWSAPDGQTMQRMLPAVSALVFILALAAFLIHGTASQQILSRIDLERINEINERIARYVVENEIAVPKLSVDRVVDYLFTGTVELAAYERFRRLYKFTGGLGEGGGAFGIFATPREAALQAIIESDVVVLTDPVLGRGAPYPMNTKIREYWDELWTWTVQNLALVSSTEIAGIPYRTFVRPSIIVHGLSGGWITSGGISIEIGASDLARWPFIILEGRAYYDVLGGELRPRAFVVDATARRGKELPAIFNRLGQRYQIAIDARTAASAASEPVKIQLMFDRFFVPSKLGISADTRELVIFAPDKRELRALHPSDAGR